MDDYGHYMTVHEGESPRLIFTQNEKLFVPGPWLTPLLPLMEQTKQAAEAKASNASGTPRETLRECAFF